MSILLGVLLGAAIALLLVLVPAIALQLTLRLFGATSSRRRPATHIDHRQPPPITEPRTRPLGLSRAVH
jgi:hypothetical protein